MTKADDAERLREIARDLSNDKCWDPVRREYVVSDWFVRRIAQELREIAERLHV